MSKNELYKKGDVIGGKYEVRDILGKGGYGVVYLVYDHELKELLALKTFRDELLANPKARNAFKKESLLWVNLEEHPHILAARWVSEVSGRLFVSMDYIAPDTQGRVSLHDHLAHANGPLDVNQVLGWAIQFCLGMEHAQAHGLGCHRDIKPGNILIAQDLTLKIADFGLAAAAATAWDKSNNRSDSLVTGTGETGFGFSVIQTEGKMRCGTPGYMAPELYRYEAADTRSDIYSFGVVLWQMITGSRVPPFMVPWHDDMGKFLQGIYEQQMIGHAPRMKGPLVLVIDRCLRPNPSERFGSFQELRSTLETIWEQRTETKFPAPHAEEGSTAFWGNKGSSLAALGRNQEAIECYDKALTVDPQNAGTWNNKGVALKELGHHEEAITCYDRALMIDSQNYAAWSNKGIVLAALGRHEEAVGCFDKALEIDPRYLQAWGNKGYALSNLGRDPEAIECHDKFLAIDPRDAKAWNNKGISLAKLIRLNEAIECFDKALSIDPLFTMALNNKGDALAMLIRFKDAIGCYDKTLTFDPRNEKAWTNKGLALDELGQHEEAINCYDKALVLNPQNAIIWTNKGLYLAKSDRHMDAIGCYEKALAINPQFVRAWYAKSVSEKALENWTETTNCFRKFLELGPIEDPRFFAQIQKKLQG